jgi:DNA-binding NtrC family response regulator
MNAKLNVLVVDGNAVLRDSLERLLARLGCAVATAASVESGMEQVRQVKYDAVFASLCLERSGCREMAKWMKDNGAPGTKFFITTGWKGELEPDLLRLNGISDVIRKPFEFSEVRDKVREHFGSEGIRGS